MSTVTLSNGYLEATVSSQGAQLLSLIDVHSQKNYLWDGKADIWAFHSPVLFPFVGSLAQDCYCYGGQTYTIGKHGFARFKEFHITSSSPHELTCMLSEDEDTLARYPFKFQLSMRYSLEGKTLKMTAEVVNTDDKAIYFSLGFHPAFHLDSIDSGSSLDMYSLRFKPHASANQIAIEKGLRLSTHSDTPLELSELKLERSTCSDGALVFSSSSWEEVVLQSESGHGVRVTLKDFPYVGFWGLPKENPQFLCIEPWQGITGVKDEKNPLLTEKKGIMALSVGKHFRLNTEIEIF